MKKLRWQLLIVVLALGAIAVLLFSQSSSTAPETTTDPAVATLQPVQGGFYSEGLIGSFSRLNPVLAHYNPADRDINRLLYSRLLAFDAQGFPKGELAESWGISQDGLVYNVSLRSDAVWHDGESVTAQDVMFTIEMLRDSELPVPEDIRNLWTLVSVEAFSDTLLTFRLPEPFTPFLDYLSFGIIPEHIYGGLSPDEFIDAPAHLNPVGSGPYRFSSFILDGEAIAGVRLEAFDDYYQPRAFIDRLDFYYFEDPQDAMAAYEDGTIRAISRIPTEILTTTLSEPNISMYSGRLPQVSMVLLNLDNPDVPFFQDLAVRQALLMAVNRERLISQFMQGQAILANGPILAGSWAYLDTNEIGGYAPEQADALLRAAGYTIPAAGGSVRAKDDVFLEFTLAHPEGLLYGQVAESLQTSWQALGIVVTLIEVAYETLISDHLDTRSYEAALIDLDFSGQYDPDPYPFWHQTQITGGQNYSQWDDRVASEYIEQARVILDVDERIRLYRNFQVRFARELPALPLFYPIYSFAVDSEIEGVRVGPLFDTSDRLAGLPSWFLISEVDPPDTLP